jgi:hypothetical protein
MFVQRGSVPERPLVLRSEPVAVLLVCSDQQHAPASAAMSGEVVAGLHVLHPAWMSRLPPEQLAGSVV